LLFFVAMYDPYPKYVVQVKHELDRIEIQKKQMGNLIRIRYVPLCKSFGGQYFLNLFLSGQYNCSYLCNLVCLEALQTKKKIN